MDARLANKGVCLALSACLLFAATPLSADPGDVALATDPTAGPQAVPSPQAPNSHRLHWRWSRFGPIDYAVTVALGGAYCYAEFGREQPQRAKWTGPILFDRSARNALVAGTRAGRNRADVLSDYSMVAPVIALWGETLIVPLLLDDWNLDVAWQMTVINLQASALNGLLTRSGNQLGVRQRPDVSNCEQDDDYNRNCFRGSTASFPSGHTSLAFVGAALSCSHHLHLPLYGGGGYDIAMCSVLGAVATATGVARIVADRHYASDVLMGAAIGVGSGLALPLLLHYRGGESASPPADKTPTTAVRWTLAPFADADGPGLSVYGWF